MDYRCGFAYQLSLADLGQAHCVSAVSSWVYLHGLTHMSDGWLAVNWVKGWWGHTSLIIQQTRLGSLTANKRICGNKQGLLGSELAQCYSCHTPLVRGSLETSSDSRWGSRLHIFMGGDAMPHCKWPGNREGWRILAIFAKKNPLRSPCLKTQSP